MQFCLGQLLWQAYFELQHCKQSTKLNEICLAAQVTLCEQLASYLAKFKPAAQSNAAAVSSADVVVPQGMQVLKKKGKPHSCLELVMIHLASISNCHSLSFSCVFFPWVKSTKLHSPHMPQQHRPAGHACTSQLCIYMQQMHYSVTTVTHAPLPVCFCFPDLLTAMPTHA